MVLDTSAYSWLRRGHAVVHDLVARAEIVYVPVTVIGELEAGFLRGSRTGQNQASLLEFLAEPFVLALSLSPSTARHYGRIVTDLRTKGQPIPTNDVWIAASTLDCGGRLLTFDRHFKGVAGLDLVTVVREAQRQSSSSILR